MMVNYYLCPYNYVFITELMVGAGVVLDCVISRDVSNVSFLMNK